MRTALPRAKQPAAGRRSPWPAGKSRAGNCRGFSLLEVILALAILTGAIAVLGELASLGMRNARVARYTTRAELLSSSKLAEITSGITLPEAVSDVSFETTDDWLAQGDPTGPEWLYSIDLAPLDEEGLVAVRVTVSQNLPPEKRPVTFSLVRWIVDPGVELSEEAAAEETSPENLDDGGGRE